MCDPFCLILCLLSVSSVYCVSSCHWTYLIKEGNVCVTILAERCHLQGGDRCDRRVRWLFAGRWVLAAPGHAKSWPFSVWRWVPRRAKSWPFSVWRWVPRHAKSWPFSVWRWVPRNAKSWPFSVWRWVRAAPRHAKSWPFSVWRWVRAAPGHAKNWP